MEHVNGERQRHTAEEDIRGALENGWVRLTTLLGAIGLTITAGFSVFNYISDERIHRSQIDSEFALIKQELSHLTRMEASQFQALTTRIDLMDERMDASDARMGQHDDRFRNISSRIQVLEQNVNVLERADARRMRDEDRTR